MAFCQRVFSFHSLHVSAVSELRGIVIPSKNGKKFPKYDFQPTLESSFQHSNFKHKSNTDKTLLSQRALGHTKSYGHKPARHEDHNNTKPIWKIIVL
jgi:hypothetical protein